MNNLGKTLVCGIAALFAVTTLADAPESATQFTPKLMNYQGYLADPSTGKPYVDGIYNLECRLYRVATDGAAIWGGEYSVYVKDGYFNIMLGDASAKDLEDCTYANTNLWCALWSDSSVTDEKERNNLWLGVTPLQNSKHNAITSPTEIKPRQQLLTAPYAFRAQSAEYANESPGDFTVNGDFKVNGIVNGALTVDGNLSVSEITLPSQRPLYINNFSAYTTGHASISSVGNLNMSSVLDAELSSRGNITISADQDVYVSAGTYGTLHGQGTLKWKSTASGEYKKPFIVKTVTVKVDGGRNGTIETFQDSEYRYFVAGARGPVGLDFCDVAPDPLNLANPSSHRWDIYVQLAETTSSDIEIHLTLFGVLNELVEDPRVL